MNSRNVCKSIPSFSAERLVTHRFVYESEASVMKKPSFLACNRLILIKSGTGDFYVENNPYPFSPGTILFIFEGETIYARPSSDCDYMYIDFSGERATALFKQFGINRGSRILNGFDGLIALWQNSLYHASPESISLAAESMILYTFSRMTVSSTKQNILIDEILKMSEDMFSLPELSISYLAEKLSYNPKYLSHLFKKKTGTSYCEYLRTLRIKYATSLFDHGLDSVKNVAFLSGFSDAFYFSSLFKKVMGISPKEYILKTSSAKK